jgi:hypothetical protein
VVECTALEMRHGCKPIGGSNPPLSASLHGFKLLLLLFSLPSQISPQFTHIEFCTAMRLMTRLRSAVDIELCDQKIDRKGNDIASDRVAVPVGQK